MANLYCVYKLRFRFLIVKTGIEFSLDKNRNTEKKGEFK